MEEPGAGTFAKLLRRLIGEGVIRTDDSALVQFAGSFDEAVCAEGPHQLQFQQYRA